MTLWEAIARRARKPEGPWLDAGHRVELGSLAGASVLGGRLEALRGRSVVIATEEALTAVLALIELDGVARRMVLCPPGVAPEHFPQVVRDAQADAWVTDAAAAGPPQGLASMLCVTAHPEPQPCKVDRRGEASATEWVLLTSGTTGGPKLVLHTLASLTAAFAQPGDLETGAPIWSTFYDVRRYGGLQILLRGLLFGSLVLPGPKEQPSDLLARGAAAGVTHISGTPSHWRKALMSGAAQVLRPAYVRLSGEIADQPILDALHAAFPQAVVAHAFASTEAGVAFEVRDGLAGFPASLAGISGEGVRIDLSRGTLRIQSPGNAMRYLGEGVPPIKDAEGFVDLGDRLERRGDRWLLRRTQRRHHQRRRNESASGGGRGRDQLSPAGAHVAGQAAPQPDHRHGGHRGSGSGRRLGAGRCRRRGGPLEADLPGDPRRLPCAARRSQGSRAHPHSPDARGVRLGQAGAPRCITSSSPAAAGGSGSRSPRRSFPGAIRVIALARSSTDELRKAMDAQPDKLLFRAFDLADTAAIGGMVADLRRETGPVYGLVNNAGLGTGGLLAMMRDRDIESLVRLNTLSPLILTKYVLRSMMAARGGRIVSVSSIVATNGFKALSAYSATKASLEGFTRSLAREVGPLGITVNAVAPGFVNTEMTKELEEDDRHRIMGRSALRRMVGPDDVATAVAYLMSEEARNVTGITLTVDAGNTT